MNQFEDHLISLPLIYLANQIAYQMLGRVFKT